MSLPVTVVTVAYGSMNIVENWVELWSSTGASCIITDNGNQKFTPSVLSKAKVLPYIDNSGFGTGINRAVQESESPVTLITNPDTLPFNSDSLKNLLSYHSKGAITGSATLNSAHEEVHSTGINPDRAWVRSQVFKAAKSLWRNGNFDWIQGSLMMVHRDDFVRIGGFSENYPLYFEDVDICSRAKARGMKIEYSNRSKFIHNEGSGSEKASATRLSCFHWGLLEFFRSHDPENSDSVRRFLIAKCFLRMISYSVSDYQASRGYMLALLSLLGRTPPLLPGSLNG